MPYIVTRDYDWDNPVLRTESYADVKEFVRYQQRTNPGVKYNAYRSPNNDPYMFNTTPIHLPRPPKPVRQLKSVTLEEASNWNFRVTSYVNYNDVLQAFQSLDQALRFIWGKTRHPINKEELMPHNGYAVLDVRLPLAKNPVFKLERNHYMPEPQLTKKP